MKRLGFLACVFIICLASKGLCGSLFAPFSMDSAKVLPKGVRSVRVIGFTTQVTDQYGDGGQPQMLGADFNRSVSWGELMQSTPAGQARGRLVGGLQAMGVNMDDSAGDVRGVVDARVTATVPTLAYGLTSRWTVGVAIPILYSNVHTSMGWAANSDFQAKVNTLSNNGYFNTLHAYDAQLQNVVATKLAQDGYEPLTDQQSSGIGDVVLAAKYQAYRKGRVAVAVSPKLILPTGRTADVNKLVDLAEGDGYWSAGVSTVLDYELTHRWILNTTAGYTMPLPTYRAERIPESKDDTISPDIDQSTRQKRGDTMSVGVGTRYAIDRAWTAGANYVFQYKQADAYFGGAFPIQRYQDMSYETEQNMHAAQVALSYSTVPLYEAHKFEVPLDVGVNLTAVLAGRNIKKSDLAAFEVAAYF